MSTSIDSIGVTLAIGSFTILGLWLLVNYLFNPKGYPNFDIADMAGTLGSVDNSELRNGTFLVLLAFVCGMFVQDLSANFDSDDGPSYAAGFRCLIAHKDDKRAEVLYSKNSDFLDLKEGHFPDYDRWKDIIDSKGSVGDDDRRKAAANAIFYHAKNVVYRNDNYFSELERYEYRIEFARSITFISFYLGIMLLFGLIVTIVFSKPTCKWLSSRTLLHDISIPLTNLLIPSFFIRSVMVLFCTVLLFFVAKDIYSAELLSYNRRVYGYYITLQKEPERSTEISPSPH